MPRASTVGRARSSGLVEGSAVTYVPLVAGCSEPNRASSQSLSERRRVALHEVSLGSAVLEVESVSGA
jgi:hypothetical protein